MQFGLIGKHLSHSFSKKYFSEKFEKEQLPHTYSLYELKEIGELPGLVKSNPGLRGLNVTIPYKETVIPLLDELSNEARMAGAVNTILLSTGRSKGFNTDIYGFSNSIKPFLEPHHQRALILGSGGSSRAVAAVFDSLGIDYFFVSREKTGKKFFSYSDLNEHVLNAFKLIVNCTPVGMYPDTGNAPQISYQYLTAQHFLYDLIYNPAETLFLTRGKEKGARVMNGLDMLKLQAERSWQIWNETADK